jgi:hypothetical protein
MADPVRLMLVLEEPAPGEAARSAGAERPTPSEAPPTLPDEPRLPPDEPPPPPPFLTLEVGQEVKGFVEVEVLEEVEFRELQLRFFWHTEGRGNRATGESGTQALARFGQWEAGEKLQFPFRIFTPWGPLSYRGKLLSVVWDLEARLDRSLLMGEVVERIPVEVTGSPDPEHASLGPLPQERRKLEAAKKGLKKLWVAGGVLLMVFGILFGALNNWELEARGKGLLMMLLSAGFLFTMKGIWGRLGRGKLGEPSVQLSTTELRRGEEIRFSVALRPDQRTELRSLDVILECEERVVQGHGQYQSRHRRTVFERRMVLAKDQVIHHHRGLRKKGTVSVPLDVPPSFGAPNNQIVWWLRFRGDIVGWPDWKEPILLTVWP